MDFISSKDFQAALTTILKAINAGQVAYVKHDTDKVRLQKLMFVRDEDEYSSAHVSFIAPDQAAKERLFELRSELNKRREVLGKNQKDLESLENEERKLAALLPTLKESP
jgi:hypothetical protein